MAALSPASAEQMACVDAVLAGNNVVVEASAGAGKSTTFYHTARSWLNKHGADTPVLLVCFNAVLRAEAMRKVAEYGLNIHCFTVHALAAAMYRTRVSDTLSLYNAVHGSVEPIAPAPYTLVLIDEAQDLNEDHMEVLNALPLSMQYMIVGDPRQEIYGSLRDPTLTLLADPAKHLRDNNKPWVRRILNTSYRLTAPVCQLLNHCFRDSNTQVEIQPGNIRSRLCRPRYVIGDKEHTDLFDILKDLLRTYAPGDIMILAPTVALTKYRCQKLAYALHTQLHVPIFSTHKHRSDLTPAMMHGKIFLSTYHQSKGYERLCVLVLGVDEHEWHLHKNVSEHGIPLVHNSLHVALTRAQEQLVIFQHYACDRYPTIQNIHEYADVLCLRSPAPRPPMPRSTSGVLLDTYLVTFQPRSILTKLVDVGGDDGLMDDSSVTAPLVKVTPDSGEDVLDAYLDAIVSWTERRYLQKACKLEKTIREAVREEQVPQEFKHAIQQVHRFLVPTTARDWMALAIVYNTMICHDYPHELYQMRHLNWMGTYESDFVYQSSLQVLSVLPPTGGFWHETAVRVLEGRTVRAKVPFMIYTEDVPEPWQFTLNDSYTEHNLLLAMVHMWVFRAKQAIVFSISTGVKHVIKAPENLNTFLIDMLAVKVAH